MTPAPAATALAFLAMMGIGAVCLRPNKPQVTFTGMATVVDGDTIRLHGIKIRLYGIDAPEFAQECTAGDGTRWPCGMAAAMRLADLTGDKIITCEKRDVDHYGRAVAVCYDGATDINAAMVRSGYAIAYRRYSSAYVDDERAARLNRVGIWPSTFTEPETYRREHHR